MLHIYPVVIRHIVELLTPAVIHIVTK